MVELILQDATRAQDIVVGVSFGLSTAEYRITPNNQAPCLQIHQMRITTGRAKTRPDLP
jgi:hypothetical protein